MRCERVQELYQDYSGGSLSVSALSRVEEHLAGCPACREYYEQSDQIAGMLRRVSEIAHPGPQYFDQLSETILYRLDDPMDASAQEHVAPIVELPTRAWQRPIWWAGAMAAAALLALSILPERALIMQSGPTMIAQADRSMPTDNLIGSALNEATGQPDIEVVQDGATGRKTLALAFNNPQLDSQASAASPDTSQALDKSFLGKNTNSPEVEDIIQSPMRTVAELSTQANQGKINPLERQETEETKVTMVKLSEEIEKKDVIRDDLIEQLQLIKTKTISQGDEALRQSLRELEQTVQARLLDTEGLSSMPIVRQSSLYLKAEDALKSGRPKEAWTYYRQILRIDENSLLAARARLQMADLYYSEFADFEKAQEFYSSLTGANAAKALSGSENDQVARRLERLHRYSADAWSALNLLHAIRHENLPTALSALRQLTQTPKTEELLPEAARTMVENINQVGDDPSALSIDVFTKITFDVYNLLENQSKVTQNKDIRAYLDLALGDLTLTQFKDTRQALICYRKVIAGVDAESMAAQSASLKLNALRDLFLAEQLR